MLFSSNISSTESHTHIRLAKAWNAIDCLSILWKSDLFDELKRDFFQAVAVSVLLYGCSSWTLKNTEKKSTLKLLAPGSLGWLPCPETGHTWPDPYRWYHGRPKWDPSHWSSLLIKGICRTSHKTDECGTSSFFKVGPGARKMIRH